MAQHASGASSELGGVLALLGGKGILRANPRTEADYIAIVRGGLPFAALRSAIGALTLSLKDVEADLRLSVRSLHRRKDGRLTAGESERVMRLVRVAARAEQVLGERAVALDWLRSPNRALEGASPMSLLDTDLGTEQVLQVLGRLEYGVYA